jgi:hypothetical protein
VRSLDRAVRPIGKCVVHPQANLRKEAAAAMGEIADPAAEPFLALSADDPDPEVRKTSVGRSSKLRPERPARGPDGLQPAGPPMGACRTGMESFSGSFEA